MTRTRNTQGGVVLIIALIVLVAMTLASVAMVRSVDTSTLIAGNLAFKQSGISSGDAGVNEAIAWLQANAGALENDLPVEGYYATSQDCLDVTGNGKVRSDKCAPPFTQLDWSDPGAVRTLSKDAAGNEVSYVIHRLCTTAGPLTAEKCSVDEGERTGNSKGAAVQQGAYRKTSFDKAADLGFYRITVRIAGQRNNVSFVQAIATR